MCGDGKTEKDVGLGLRRRAQAGANRWRAVEGEMADRRISKILKGKVTSTCVIEELDRETGEEQTTVDRTRRKDGR